MLQAISLYTGVGGLDFGFEAAGFRTAVAVELDDVSCRTIRLNRRWPVLEGDIHSFSSSEILNAAKLKAGDADVLIGGPPCQPFSKSSYWVSGDSRRLDDPRSDTLTAYLRVLRDTRPRAFLLENVYGLAYKGKDEGLRYLLEGIAEVNRQVGTNYKVHWQMLNAASFGVPQVRERVFLVGSRDGTPFHFPAPRFSSNDESDLLNTSTEPLRTAWDAIGDLPSDPDDKALTIGGYWGNLIPSIPEGQNYLWHTPRGGGMPLFGWRTRYWSFLLKLSKHRPSWTIQAQPGSAIGPFHWRNRKLSVHEMCRLQTFPDGLRFDCGRTDAQKMLGNAVPSLLAEVLAREIRYQLLGQKRRLTTCKLLPPRLEKVPKAEKVRSVPKEYHELLGDHADHPGEGRGAHAVRRKAKPNAVIGMPAQGLLIPADVDLQ
jgi:DNA (cytosine-5)-methyltransferase 1